MSAKMRTRKLESPAGTEGKEREVKVKRNDREWKGMENRRGNGFNATEAIFEGMCEPLIDPREAAAILKVCTKTVKHRAAEGSIPALRIGRFWRFRASALDAWICTQLAEASEKARIWLAARKGVVPPSGKRIQAEHSPRTN